MTIDQEDNGKAIVIEDPIADSPYYLTIES
jgi:hypothetical protein